MTKQWCARCGESFLAVNIYDHCQECAEEHGDEFYHAQEMDWHQEARDLHASR